MRWASLFLLLPLFAWGQADYPARPVRIVVPSPPGGGTDIVARVLGQHLSKALGQPFVVENKPGAGNMIGIEHVARSSADGYTLLMVASTLALNSVLFKKVPYDPVRDFAPITIAATAPNVLIVNPALPAQTLAEFIALAKKKPGALSYGTPGIGTSPHLSMELLKSMAGIDVLHGPYRGSAAARLPPPGRVPRPAAPRRAGFGGGVCGRAGRAPARAARVPCPGATSPPPPPPKTPSPAGCTGALEAGQSKQSRPPLHPPPSL